ncbi:MAG: FAD:protein FMN transferase [Flavobacteriales bacterium]
MKWKILISCAAMATLLCAACSNSSQSKPLTGRTYSGLLFGKPYQIECIGDSADCTAQIDSIMAAYENCFSLALPGSLLSRYNAFQRTDTVFAFVDSTRAFGVVYDMASDFNRLSMHYFDPTTNPMKRHWAIAHFNQLTEPNLDSLFLFIGFDGSKMDLNERYDDSGAYRISELRKADPRIEADFTELAAAVALDHIGELLLEKKLLQFNIKYEHCVLNHGMAIDSLNSVSMGLATEEADQQVRIVNRAFCYKTTKDKAAMIDVTYGYPVQNEMAYTGVSARRLSESVVFAEAFMIMGIEKIAEFYTANPESDIQSFVFHQQDDMMVSSSTEGFDEMLLVADSTTAK